MLRILFAVVVFCSFLSADENPRPSFRCQGVRGLRETKYVDLTKTGSDEFNRTVFEGTLGELKFKAIWSAEKHYIYASVFLPKKQSLFSTLPEPSKTFPIALVQTHGEKKDNRILLTCGYIE